MQKISSVLVLILFIFVGVEGFSQASTNSPYSRFGIGLLRSESFNQNFALGGTGIGLRSYNNINLINPASFSDITITCFEVAATNNALWLSDGKQTQYNNNPHINYLAFAFPVISNKWGMAFGAKPYSAVGYNYNTVQADSIAGNVSYYYAGDGGITKVFFGNALKFKIDSTSNISAGYNLSFLFGNINSDKKVILGSLPNSFNLWEVSNRSIADFTSDFGLQYQKSFTNIKDEKFFLTIGATYALGADLKTKTTSNIRTFTGNIDFGALKDTVEYIEDANDVTSIPSRLGGGIALEKENKWTLAVDFRTVNYGDIKSLEQNVSFKNNYTISSGFEFIPKYDAFSNYLKRIKYKFGARYSTAYLTINNTDITEYGITFGLGLPIKRTDSAMPGLNLGVEYGNRGVESNGLVKETFVNFNVGITINDRWFIKRKYD